MRKLHIKKNRKNIEGRNEKKKHLWMKKFLASAGIAGMLGLTASCELVGLIDWTMKVQHQRKVGSITKTIEAIHKEACEEKKEPKAKKRIVDLSPEIAESYQTPEKIYHLFNVKEGAGYGKDREIYYEGPWISGVSITDGRKELQDNFGVFSMKMIIGKELISIVLKDKEGNITPVVFGYLYNAVNYPKRFDTDPETLKKRARTGISATILWLDKKIKDEKFYGKLMVLVYDEERHSHNATYLALENKIYPKKIEEIETTERIDLITKISETGEYKKYLDEACFNKGPELSTCVAFIAEGDEKTLKNEIENMFETYNIVFSSEICRYTESKVEEWKTGAKKEGVYSWGEHISDEEIKAGAVARRLDLGTIKIRERMEYLKEWVKKQIEKKARKWWAK